MKYFLKIFSRWISPKAFTPAHDELFNLAEDPGEAKDVAAKHPNIVNRLRKQLAKTRDQGFSNE